MPVPLPEIQALRRRGHDRQWLEHQRRGAIWLCPAALYILGTISSASGTGTGTGTGTPEELGSIRGQALDFVDAMKSHTEYFTFHTKKKRELVHLTPRLEDVLEKSGIAEGFMLVSAMHITAGVFVNDDEPGLHEDIWKWLEGIAPFKEDYRHHRTGEDNGDAHLKSLLMHHEVIVPITKGRLDLGTWQRVFYAEFDGKRDKRLIVKVLGE